MRHSTRVCAALALTAGLVGGCTNADDPPESTAPTSDEVITDQQPDEPNISPGEDQSPEPIPGQDGAATALSTAADYLGGQALALERSDDEELWAVSVAVDDQAVEVLISINGQAVVEEGQTRTLGDEESQRLAEAAISASEAAVTAAQQLGATVQEVDLEETAGSVVWEIELQTTDGASTPAAVDAITGEVL